LILGGYRLIAGHLTLEQFNEYYALMGRNKNRIC